MIHLITCIYISGNHVICLNTEFPANTISLQCNKTFRYFSWIVLFCYTVFVSPVNTQKFKTFRLRVSIFAVNTASCDPFCSNVFCVFVISTVSDYFIITFRFSLLSLLSATPYIERFLFTLISQR